MDRADRPQQQGPPVACSLDGTPGAFAERMAEYRRLFGQHLAGRSRTGTAITFRFRAGPGVEDWVRDLARREKACCPFFDFTVTADGQQVRWDVAVADDEAAREALDGFYHLGSERAPRLSVTPGREHTNHTGPGRRARRPR